MGGLLSSGNGLGRCPAERRRGRDWWLRRLSGSLFSVDNDADANANCVCDVDPNVNARTYSDSHSDGNTNVNANAYSDSHSDGNAKTDPHTAIQSDAACTSDPSTPVVNTYLEFKTDLLVARWKF